MKFKKAHLHFGASAQFHTPHSPLIACVDEPPAPPPGGPPAVTPPAKTFSQDEVNTMMATERRTTEARFAGFELDVTLRIKSVGSLGSAAFVQLLKSYM